MFIYQQSTYHLLPLWWDRMKCHLLTTGLIHTHSTHKQLPCQYHLLSELTMYWESMLPENKLRIPHLADNGSSKESLRLLGT